MTQNYGFPDRLSVLQRAGLGLVVAVLLVPSWLAWQLTPNARGYGTHEQLGLPPCSFMSWCGRPCPTCGMTTAWSHSVRGEWSRALDCNVAGTLLAAGSWLTAAWLAAGAARGRWLARLDSRAWLVAAAAAGAVALLEWICRLTAG